MFSEERIADLPDAPTAKEIGVKTVFEERVMAFAPKGTPRDKLDVVAKAMQASLEDAEVKERFKALGIDRQFIAGPKLREILDGLKGPIVTVGEEVRKARDAQAAEKKP